MIENIFETEELRALARRKKRTEEFRTVPNERVKKSLSEGWSIHRENKASTRISRKKRHDILLEDRVWSLLYSMGFCHLSGDGGAHLYVQHQNADGPKNQIDVVGLDSEVAIAVECKSALQLKKDTLFQSKLAKHNVIRQRFANATNTQFPLAHKRIPILAMFTSQLELSDNDIKRAREQKVALLNEHDLHYYEQLVSHLGPAAKYQFLADVLPDRRIHGLKKAIPALQTRVGSHTCYTFSISPEYLLKFSYVAHRAKGKATEVDTYQRMVKRSRLKKIREYITNGGVFPTNIVISLDGKRVAQFEQKEQSSGIGARYGTLHLNPAYRSAWIIDGQHRLFGYSGHEYASSSHLSVLAFVNLPVTEQAHLFIDINHEQKSVKRSLLQELFAELNWDAEDDDKRAGAILSKTIQGLSESPESPLYGRVLLTDASRTATRCISLGSLFSALSQTGIYIFKKGVQYGPLWTGDNTKTLNRSLQVIKAWFGWIRQGSAGWWELGADEGGGLAMNDGVTICIGVLRSVFQHLAGKGVNLLQLTDQELVMALKPYGLLLGSHFGTFSAEDRYSFRTSSRGNQGRTASRHRLEKAIHDKYPEFSPPGWAEYTALEEGQTNEKAYAIIQRLEKMLQNIVLDTLQAEYGDGDDQPWWNMGVPQGIRLKAVTRREEDQGKGKPEEYLDLIDFRTIILRNWSMFQDTVAYGDKGNKEKKTAWIKRLNDMRKVVMHPAKRQAVSWSELEELDRYKEWLQGKSNDNDNDEDG